jgi:hypothetical protein
LMMFFTRWVEISWLVFFVNASHLLGVHGGLDVHRLGEVHGACLLRLSPAPSEEADLLGQRHFALTLLLLHVLHLLRLHVLDVLEEALQLLLLLGLGLAGKVLEGGPLGPAVDAPEYLLVDSGLVLGPQRHVLDQFLVLSPLLGLLMRMFDPPTR